MEILRFENLSFTYPKAEKAALDNISFSVNSGDFVVICGESGCGKTTLLKMIKKELSPFGQKNGRILYNGTSVEELSDRESCEIGYVMQNPDLQIVTDKVWHELAFGLENMGCDTQVIRRRVGEMASFFGIQEWFRSNTDELSGGQKQLLCLASVMVMQPKLLLLDEPTSQLDPIAAADFLATLKRLNNELGLTIILVEQRLEDVFPNADKILLMDNAETAIYDTPQNTGKRLKEISANHRMLEAMPAAVRIYNSLDADTLCPLTVKEARSFITENYNILYKDCENIEYTVPTDEAVTLKDVYFRYERDSQDVLKGLSFTAHRGELLCILGGNGTGKTTALNVISGTDRAYRGKVLINGKKIKDYTQGSLYKENLSYLPQNPLTVFTHDTVEDDLSETAKVISGDNAADAVTEVANELGIKELLGKHPYDLSGGQQQKCALAKLLLTKPRILLLDEPTKGLDSYSKRTLREILLSLKAKGVCIVTVTHDVEFAATAADICALFFDGDIISSDTPQKFFSENSFYTTAANRISRGIYNGCVTCEAVSEMCRRNGEKQ